MQIQQILITEKNSISFHFRSPHGLVLSGTGKNQQLKTQCLRLMVKRRGEQET